MWLSEVTPVISTVEVPPRIIILVTKSLILMWMNLHFWHLLTSESRHFRGRLTHLCVRRKLASVQLYRIYSAGSAASTWRVTFILASYMTTEGPQRGLFLLQHSRQQQWVSVSLYIGYCYRKHVKVAHISIKWHKLKNTFNIHHEAKIKQFTCGIKS